MSSLKSQVSGWIGEKVTRIAIFLSLDKKIYHRFHDVIINSPDSTNQLDHVIISPAEFLSSGLKTCRVGSLGQRRIQIGPRV